MIKLCIFGGYDGQLSLGGGHRIYFTLFGATKLRRPTLARQLIEAKRAGQGGGSRGKATFITIFGGVEFKSPTLAEEFIDMREAIDGGALNAKDWDKYMSELYRVQSDSFATLTLFAGLDESVLPSEDDEVNSLALQRHLGNISDDSGYVLEHGVGQAGAQRHAVIQKAVSVA